MKKNLILPGILFLLVAAYFFFVHNRGGSSLAKEESDFAIEDTAAIERITMRAVKDGAVLASVMLERDPQGGWLLDSRHKAVEPRVHNLLETLYLMRVRSTLSEAGQKKGRELIAYQHVWVQVFDKDGLIRSFYVGPQSKDGSGTAMLMEGAETPYIVGIPGFEGFLNPRFSVEYDRWRENLLFDARADQLQEIALTFTGQADRSWRLQSHDGNWSLSGVEAPADSAAIRAYLDLFKGKVYGESFAGVYYPNKIDTLATESPDMRFELTYLDGRHRNLLLYHRADNLNNFFGWIEGEEELLTVQRFVFDPYLVEKSHFVEN